MACIRGFLSGAFYFSVKILSHVPISQDIDCHGLKRCPSNTVYGSEYWQCERHLPTRARTLACGQPIQIYWQPCGPLGMWCLTKPSFADIGHKMLTLWALAIMLAVQAGALDPSTSPLPLGALPDKITSGLPIHFPISVPDLQVPRISPIRKGSPPHRHAAGTSGGRCLPVAKYLVSSSKLNDCK